MQKPANGTQATATVTVPSNLEGNKTQVKIPMQNGSAATVAVLIKADGTEEVVLGSSWKDGVLTVPLTGSAKIAIRDNAKTFGDINAQAWYASDVAFVTSRGLLQGMGDGNFAPQTPTNRAMIFVVIQRLAGESLAPKDGENWYENAMQWAKKKALATAQCQWRTSHANSWQLCFIDMLAIQTQHRA